MKSSKKLETAVLFMSLLQTQKYQHARTSIIIIIIPVYNTELVTIWSWSYWNSDTVPGRMPEISRLQRRMGSHTG